MLIVVIIIQIPTVLFHTRINSKSAWVDLLDPEIIWLELAIDLAFLLSICIVDPDTLDVSTFDVIVPLVVWSPCVFLWCREEAGGRHVFWIHQRNFIPHGSRLGC